MTLKELIIEELQAKFDEEKINKLREFSDTELLEMFYQEQKDFCDFLKKYKSFKTVVNYTSESLFSSTKKRIDEYDSLDLFMKEKYELSGNNAFRYYDYEFDRYEGYKKITTMEYFLGGMKLSDSNNHCSESYAFTVDHINKVINVSEKHYYFD